MFFEEPKVEFISITNENVFWSSCGCVDGSAGSAESCVGNNSFSDGGCDGIAENV